jgi:hypothetical protein
MRRGQRHRATGGHIFSTGGPIWHLPALELSAVYNLAPASHAFLTDNHGFILSVELPQVFVLIYKERCAYITMVNQLTELRDTFPEHYANGRHSSSALFNFPPPIILLRVLVIIDGYKHYVSGHFPPSCLYLKTPSCLFFKT